MPDGAELDNLILAIEAEAAALPASPDVEALARDWEQQADAIEAATEPKVAKARKALAAETLRACARSLRAAALPAAPAGLDDLLHRVDEAIGGAPGMYVAGYDGSMIGRDHAVRVVSDALRAAYAEGEPE
jgi:hypothetical protein